MFVAKKSNGSIISLLHSYQREEAQNASLLFCPACSSEVILKKGAKRQWHFAHKISSLCSSQNEPETEEHLAGKQRLYYWLKKQGLPVFLEHTLPVTKRRADLYLPLAPRPVAIEFQSASMTDEECLNRTRDYLKEGVWPVWIFSLQRFRSRHPMSLEGITSLYSFEWIPLRESVSLSHRFLIYYSPAQQRFHFLFPLTSLSSRRTFYQQTLLHETELSFSHLFNPPVPTKPPTVLFPAWMKVKKQWRYGRKNNREGIVYNEVNKLFASHYRDSSLFSAEAGWPIVNKEELITKPLWWQSWLLFFLSTCVKEGRTIKEKTLWQEFNGRMEENGFQKRVLPLLTGHDEYLFIYIRFIEKAGLVEEVEKGVWKQKRSLYLPSSLDEGYFLDVKISKAFFSFFSSFDAWQKKNT
ncbi:competence protein CoiA [Thalassorhabdus alkalitolerans]|uniref:Competence protein CoiA n=1 Tax=Thalassorhabdus alkalitolerans TaxID=2282697 RepID=A0ABW0YMX4_9BACI